MNVVSANVCTITRPINGLCNVQTGDMSVHELAEDILQLLEHGYVALSVPLLPWLHRGGDDIYLPVAMSMAAAERGYVRGPHAATQQQLWKLSALR